MLALYLHTNIKCSISAHVQYEADPHGERFKDCVWGRWIFGVAGSKPAEGITDSVYWVLYVVR